jgi:protein SCO1/2
MRGEDSRPPDRPEKPRGVPLSVFFPVIVIAVVVGSVTMLLADNHSSPALPGNVHSESVTGFYGQLVSPRKPAPSVRGPHNYLGERVDLADYRGKAVFVTFLYTHCPDICPLMTSELRDTLERLGPYRSRQLQIVAISVDPNHDTRRAVAQFLKAHGMTGRMKYLIGDAEQLGKVWEAWNVGSTPDSVNPELVAHSALIYGISASGKLTTIYPENFQPEQIIHDLSKLLQE